jgi:hypothetical protein
VVTAILTFLSFAIAKSEILEIPKNPNETKILSNNFENSKRAKARSYETE